MSVTTSVETITPELAREWLGFNTHNRGIKERVVEKYASAIKRGEWNLNGESIKWNGEVLLDGQHRLLAVIKAEQSIQSVVVRGLTGDAQDTMDGHAPRTLADRLALHGEVSTSDLASALSHLYRADLGRESSTEAPSLQQALQLLEKYPQTREAVRLANPVNSKLSIPRGLAASLYVRFSLLDEDDAAFYFDRLTDGVNLETTSPIYVFREWCLSNLRAASTLRPHVQAGQKPTRGRIEAYAIKAWNAFRRGDEMKLLKWSVGGAKPEPFPQPE